MLEELLLPCKSTSQAAAAEELQHHHRQLLVPAAVVDTPIPTDVVAWASVLCCVFTHVIVIADTEIDAAAACDSAYDIPPALLIDYDGSAPARIQLCVAALPSVSAVRALRHHDGGLQSDLLQ